jgi:gentisate 1,2-dioxygenase
VTQQPDPHSHYYVQLNRRFKFLEDWRRVRRELAQGSNLRLAHSPVRNAAVGVLVGDAAAVPTKMIDARVMEIAPGARTSTHRHTHDAVIFVLQGRGATTIDDVRHEWEPWDALHTPAWSWHGHEAFADGARLLAVTDAPLIAALNLSRVEDVGDAQPRFEATPSGLGSATADASIYEAALTASDRVEASRQEATRITRWRDVTLRASPRGTRTALLVDRSLGFHSSGLSMALFQIAPGMAQAKHRHSGEAILYIVDGRGYSVIEDDRFDWETGDAVIVHRYAWHQHFNADPERPATVIRLHMWESVIEMMQAAMDPVPLYEDDPAMATKKAVWDQVTPDVAGRTAGPAE